MRAMVTAEALLASESPLSFDPTYASSCPCARIEGDGFRIDVHCWRIGHCCRWSGVHVTGSLPKATLRKLGSHVKRNAGWDAEGFAMKLEPYEERDDGFLERDQ